MYDCAIIGAGPAGLSAALNLQLHNKSFIWFGTVQLSDKIRKAEKIANYPGMPYISGQAFQQALLTQIQQMDIQITDKMVTMVTASGNTFMILADNQVYKAKSVILATGIVSDRSIPGESDFVGKGVSYCATCDGFLYRDKTIAVLSRNKRFEHEVNYLAEIAETVYYFADYQNTQVNKENIILMKEKCTNITGDLKLRSLTLSNNATLDIDGFFILRDAIVPTTLLPGLLTEKQRIYVDRDMATNIPGCFACGDCTGAPYQYAKAVGEGNIAVHSVIKYLADT